MPCLVAHAGDSPTFLLSDGEMSLLTPPHTVSVELLGSGRLTKEQSQRHPGQHTLTAWSAQQLINQGKPQPAQ